LVCGPKYPSLPVSRLWSPLFLSHWPTDRSFVPLPPRAHLTVRKRGRRNRTSRESTKFKTPLPKSALLGPSGQGHTQHSTQGLAKGPAHLLDCSPESSLPPSAPFFQNSSTHPRARRSLRCSSVPLTGSECPPSCCQTSPPSAALRACLRGTQHRPTVSRRPLLPLLACLAERPAPISRQGTWDENAHAPPPPARGPWWIFPSRAESKHHPATQHVSSLTD
jgi:hypothetical protein